MMEKNCNQFEELFINQDETLLLEHIKGCSYCRMEYEKMQKVSKLINEVRPLYRRRKIVRKNTIAMAASFLMIFLAFFAVQVLNTNSLVSETIASISGANYTYEQMGLPVDEYGLIMVDYGE